MALRTMAAVFDIELDLPREASAVATAREALRGSLPDDIDPRSASDLVLLVSELVANAVEHGEGAIRVRLRSVDGNVVGEVVDQGRGFEREVREVGLDEVRGRGLLIVDALSSRWGVHEGTTHVWFELALGASPTSDSGPALGESERPSRLPPLE